MCTLRSNGVESHESVTSRHVLLLVGGEYLAAHGFDMGDRACLQRGFAFLGVVGFRYVCMVWFISFHFDSFVLVWLV